MGRGSTTMSGEKRHRVFIAINLPADIKKQLGKYQEKWPELQGKWTPKDNLHITLEFLGDMTDLQIADVCQVTKEVAGSHESFSVTLSKVMYGPEKKIPPRMIWVKGEADKGALDLKNDLEDSLIEKVDYKPEGRGFSPHITLARLSAFAFREFNQDEIPEVDEMIDFTFTVESIEVMESELKKGGPVYTVLESFSLQS